MHSFRESIDNSTPEETTGRCNQAVNRHDMEKLENPSAADQLFIDSDANRAHTRLLTILMARIYLRLLIMHLR